MPIFDYHCHDCDAQFEVLARYGDRMTCSACGSSRVERLLSLPAPPRSRVPTPAAPACPSPPHGGCCGGGACGLH